MDVTLNKVVAACEKHWDKYKTDCSGFAKAVAEDFGIVLTGQANDIVDQIQKQPWQLLKSGFEASNKAGAGLVVAGLKGAPLGHVAIVVSGPLASGKYPTAYWGQLGGVGKKQTTLNWSWNKSDRDKVIYAVRSI